MTKLKDMSIGEIEDKLQSMKDTFKFYYIFSFLLITVSIAKVITEDITLLDSMTFVISFFIFAIPLFLRYYIEQTYKEIRKSEMYKKYVDKESQ